ncbi:hypothetical protein [Streptomyces sp. NBC_00872]|uniref:hypothetical protein n=1 Tax=Streptomyces sp. NBC_00872 TaxID=2903686 RepID=UPI00386B6D54
MADSYKDPGTPDRRSAGGYLWWLVTSQRGRVVAGATFGSVWMTGLALPPYLLSRAIDDGLVPGDRGALLGWAGALLGIGALNAWVGIMRHRTMTRVRMDATFRTIQVVGPSGAGKSTLGRPLAGVDRLDTARDADRVAVMDDGRLTELGTHDALVAAGGPYAELWRSWHGEPSRPPEPPESSEPSRPVAG